MDTHEAIIKSLAEELGCKCETLNVEPSLFDPPKSCYWWITPDNLWFSVDIIGDKISFPTPPQIGGWHAGTAPTRTGPLIFELSHPQLIEQLKEALFE